MAKGDKKLRSIVFFVPALTAGGAERMVVEIANQLSREGHHISVITITSSCRDHYLLHSKVRRVGLNLLWDSHNLFQRLRSNFVRIRRIRSEISSCKPQVVISFVDQTNVRVLAALLGVGIPVIVSERVDPRKYRIGLSWSVLRRMLYPTAASVVVQTESVRTWAEKVVHPSKVRVIPNFVRQIPNVERKGPRSNTTRSKIILAVGRLEFQKGFDLLIDAFAQVSKLEPGWRLTILGEGSERGTLEGRAVERGVNDRVDLPGIVSEPAEWMRAASLFVLSSRFEGFPNALLEAMSCGLPCISFKCDSGPSEIIRQSVNGLLVYPINSDALAEAMFGLMRNRDERERLASNARDVNERFSIESVMCSWNTLIEEVIRQEFK